jgi:hypothetical protein
LDLVESIRRLGPARLREEGPSEAWTEIGSIPVTQSPPIPPVRLSLKTVPYAFTQTDFFGSLATIPANLVEGEGKIPTLVSETSRYIGKSLIRDSDDLTYPVDCRHFQPLSSYSLPRQVRSQPK